MVAPKKRAPRPVGAGRRADTKIEQHYIIAAEACRQGRASRRGVRMAA